MARKVRRREALARHQPCAGNRRTRDGVCIDPPQQCGGDAAGPPGDDRHASGISAVLLRPLPPDRITGTRASARTCRHGLTPRGGGIRWCPGGSGATLHELQRRTSRRESHAEQAHAEQAHAEQAQVFIRVLRRQSGRYDARHRRGTAAAVWRRPPGHDHGAGHSPGRQPELAAARATRTDVAGGLHPPREDHALRPRAHTRAHRACTRQRRAWLLRAHRVAREVHHREDPDRDGKAHARVLPLLHRGGWRRLGGYPARRARLRRQVLHERGPLGPGGQQHTRADRRGATGPGRGWNSYGAARRVRSAGQPVSAAQLHSRCREHRRGRLSRRRVSGRHRPVAPRRRVVPRRRQ